MPTIVDANCCSKTFSSPPNPEFMPIVKAIFSGKVTLACGGRLQREYALIKDARSALVKLEQAGRLILLNKDKVDFLEKELIAKNACVSDDQHVIAIAQLSGARLLCSHDHALHTDFQNKSLVDQPRGKIYQHAGHASLIKALGL
ncbi:MAG: hypothetical protein KJ850_06500 [Gammaproteobacteria bacterium]|nr:hypothetical protein [Gammaproteobacteria bacterium]MBU1624686.1 hypothetical protein [Gammaproteobacteria bacterium]MBU1982530.1 hypothetical protein [Gammaproteobacteria bacterium]